MSPSKRKRPISPEGVTRTQLKALTGFEGPAATIIGAFISKHGSAVGQSIYKAWKGNESLFVQIDASWKDGGYYYAALSFRNLTEHGVYLESIWISDPKNTPLDVQAPKKLNSMSFGASEAKDPDPKWLAPDRVLPVLIAADSDIRKQFVFRISDFHESSENCMVLSTRETITLRYKSSQLDRPRPEEKFKTVQIRRAGPAFAADNDSAKQHARGEQ